MTPHYELCKITAEWALKKYNAYLALYEYQSFASGEFPDVLLYTKTGGTILFEIKVERSDFLADQKKEARKKWKPKVGMFFNRKKDTPYLKAQHPELYYIEAPHLGTHRYYVCPKGLISSQELPDGWGLYWVSDNGRFYKKQDSGKWRANVHEEKLLVTHAFRRYASGGTTGILIDTYTHRED